MKNRVAAVAAKHPGLGVANRGGELQVTISEKLRHGHEAHFAAVTKAFLGYLQNPKTVPAWEKANMLAKYHVTTGGVELSRKS